MDLPNTRQHRPQRLHDLRGRLRAALGGDTARCAMPRALLAFALLIAGTTWLWHEASQEATRLAQGRFAFKVKEAQFAIEQRLKAYEQMLRGGVGLFVASGEVRREAWRDYVRTLDIAKNYPGIQGIGFALHVPLAQLDAHVRSVRTEGFPAYTIRPTGVRDEYTAIIYLEPFDWRNQRAFGYDMFSEAVRHAAMVAARDSGQPTVSGKVTLVQETSKDVQRGFLMYLPVYRRGEPTATPAKRAAALVGYVYAPFRMNDLMLGALEAGTWSEIDLQIYDGEAVVADALLYDSRVASPRAAAAFVTDRRFEFGGRHWALRFSSTPAFEGAIDAQKPRLILFSGLIISVLVTLVVWWSTINRMRTREIAAANRELRHEIKNRARLTIELEQAKSRAEMASQAKSDFLANVSHELRTPLTLMLGPLDQLLAQEAPAPDWRARTERVRRNALRLLTRVNDILDFSKAEAGKTELRWEHVDLAQALAPLMDDAAAAAEINGCVLNWRVDEAIGCVNVDPRHLDNILMNFVGNALKFTPAGGRIDVVAQPVDEDWFELSISDTGIGIPAHALPGLFERFHQVDSSATRRHGGTGIGLALVKELAEAMGGRVGVESRPGLGSRFFVRLRRRGAAHTISMANAALDAATLQTQAALRRARLTVAAAQPPAVDTEASAPKGGAACILLADDHADLRIYVAELLGNDYAVVLAEDGEQAWALLQKHPVDLVLSDVMMPNVDGFTLTARVKSSAHLSHLPVILLTARGGAHACVSGLACGADDYIAKPFAPEELKARVRAALRMSHTQAQLRERTREAGMAMLAVGLLHNLGNALNGVTVSSALIRDKLRQSSAGRLRRVVDLLRTGLQMLPQALRQQHGAPLLAYVERLADQLESEQAEVLKEVDAIHRSIEHATAVIEAQQHLAKPGAQVDELHGVNELMDAALDLASHAFRAHDVTIERDYRCDIAVLTDRHKVLQILLNLLCNAHEALDAVPSGARRMAVRTAMAGETVHLEVTDNGMGIAVEHLGGLFNQGFTTKPLGHGHGLHSSANWARELGGSLAVHSEGLGRGATFTLKLRLRETAAAATMETA
jgi:signal transduction histidine kinase